MASKSFENFVVDVAQGHPGVASGLIDASLKVPEEILMLAIRGLEKKGQDLYNLYGDWLREDDKRYEAAPPFSTYLVDLITRAAELASQIKLGQL